MWQVLFQNENTIYHFKQKNLCSLDIDCLHELLIINIKGGEND